MKLRRGRFNVVEFVNEKIVRKIGIIQERSRPTRLKIEAWALTQARERGVNSPRVLDYYHRRSDGKEVIILERIHGETLSRRITQENAESMCEVGVQLTLLEGISENYGWINPDCMKGESDNWESFILTYVAFYGARLVDARIIEEKDLQVFCDALEGIDFGIKNPHLVSRDIKPSNIIRDEEGRVWILDWEDVMLGDPIFDLAVFGVKYGHGVLWKNLVKGRSLDVSLPRYIPYEIIGLIGMIDFYRKHEIGYYGRQKQLLNLIYRKLAL